VAGRLAIRPAHSRSPLYPAPGTGPVVGAVPAVRQAIEVDTVFAVATALTVGHRQGYGLATTLASTQKRDNSNVAADLLFLGGAEGI
jgi:hypothetical protein